MENIFNIIYRLRREFTYKYGKEPNAVYMGCEEYDQLISSPEIFRYVGSDVKIKTVFGLRIYKVAEENHLNVGIVIE